MRSLRLSKPHIIVMVGVPGAGKSFFAEHFSRTFSIPLVSWRAIRDELFNTPTYNEDEDVVVGRIARHMLNELCKTTSIILYESSIQSQTHRQEIARLAKRAGYEITFVWVQIDEATAKTRTAKNGLTSRQYRRYIDIFSPPDQPENPVVISGKHTFASQVKIVLLRLSQPRTSRRPPARSRPTNRTITVR